MARPRKNIVLDFPALDAALDTGRIDLKSLAVQYGTCPPVIKRILSEHYGSGITFKVGRKGGVVRSSPSSQSQQAASVAVSV
jgi:hypothetical protein